MDTPRQEHSDLQESDPVYATEAPGGRRYCLYRYADVSAAFKDKRFGAAPAPPHLLRALRCVGLSALANAVESGFLVSLNPPDHTRLRKVIEPFFLVRAIPAWKPRVETIVEDLLAPMGKSQQFDFIADFAAPLPTRVIAEMFGFPEQDVAPLKRWSDEMAALVDSDLQRSAFPRRLAAFLKFRRRVLQLVKERSQHPRDDLLSALANAYLVRGELTKDEVVGTAVFVLTAGHATTTHLIGSCLLILLKNPGVAARLREDPDLIDRVVEETLRLESTIQRTGRVLLEDVEIHGLRLPKGTKIRLMIGDANRDPLRFEHPGQFDIARHDKRHLGFGSGIHQCIGLHLARLEARIAISVKRHPILTSYRRPKMTPLWAWVAGPIRCSHHTAQPYRASGVR
ncbi:hypothetical protein DDZ14_19150, partial [Maritimibacter sp. 55A14]|uniref:cytochrome P450 n=1 Tax=Maritimibacter sp. 55A14 TaxID=2174844 RepID=UPI000D6181F6